MLALYLTQRVSKRVQKVVVGGMMVPSRSNSMTACDLPIACA